MNNMYRVGSNLAGFLGSQIPSLAACAVLTGGDLEKTVQYHLLNTGIRWACAIGGAMTGEDLMALILPEFAGYTAGRYVYRKIERRMNK